MKTSAYWKQRFTQLEDAQHKMAAASQKEIELQYQQAMKQIEGEINKWYLRLADNNGVSLAEARKMLTGSDLEEFKWDVSQYIQYGKESAISGTWAKQLENASAKFHISKMEALKIQTQQSLESLFGKQSGTMTSTMQALYQSGYYHTAYELQKGFGIGWDIAGLDQSEIEKIISKPWAVDGYNFSDRIWNNKEKLIQTVHKELTQNIMLGQDPQKAIDAIAKQMNTSKTNAGRLVMTEEAYFSSLAQKDCFKDLDVEKYEIVATLDSHTSEICRNLDGQVFDMKDYEPGVTAPPFHVWCRSTTAPYFDDDFGQVGERAARDEESGDTYYVPDDMNYHDWEETFVNGGDKSDLTAVVDDSGLTHYQKNVAQEATKPKKEYLTKKKLQAKIADADVQIEDLQEQFSKQMSGLYTWDEFQKDYGGDYSSIAFDESEEAALKSIGDQIDALEAQKAEWQEKLNEKLVKEQKKELVKQQLDLEQQKAVLQQQLDDMEVKTYSGIWKDDVTTADYSHLNIQGKKDYYEQQLAIGTADPDKLKQFQEYLDQLEELETEGKSYADVQKQIQDIDKKLKSIEKDLNNLEKNGTLEAADDPFTDERKDAALWAKDTKDADDALRDTCGKVWKAASQEEQSAIFDYTNSYHKFNEPLRGIEYGTNAFKGVGNVDLDQIGVSYSGFKPGQMRKEINAMTDIIEKSTYDFDMWVQRGCNYGGMDKFFGVSLSQLQNATQQELEQLLLQKTVTEFGFCSAGVSKGKGFSSCPIILNIYAPKGTQMMYAEPFSAFGNGSGRRWDGVTKQKTFGSESEIILQQGTSFRITKIEKSRGKLYFDLEVIDQSPQR